MTVENEDAAIELVQHGNKFIGVARSLELNLDNLLPILFGDFQCAGENVLEAAVIGKRAHDKDLRIPDRVVMGNGMPIGGVTGKSHLLDKFGKRSRYFNTFAGDPVCCAAALAVLKVIESEQLLANSLTVGGYLHNALADLAGRYPQIGNVRGAGLFVGVEFVEDRNTREPNAAGALACVNALRDKRILISTMGPYGSTLKIRPPLPFTREAADQLVASLAECLENTGSSLLGR